MEIAELAYSRKLDGRCGGLTNVTDMPATPAAKAAAHKDSRQFAAKRRDA